MSALVFLDLKEMEKHAQVEKSIFFNFHCFSFFEGLTSDT